MEEDPTPGAAVSITPINKDEKEFFANLSFNGITRETLHQIVQFAVELGEQFHLIVDDPITDDELIHEDND